jgi:RNA polymerase sigma factor (sigma-70 family)
VAALTRKVGLRHLELVEDTVQFSLMVALTAWSGQGLPDDPSAWLYRVAYNRLIGELRRQSGQLRLLDLVTGDLTEDWAPDSYFASEVSDDLLRMLFVCCSAAIPRDTRLVLALKTLCGFSAAEIALRLFTTPANVHKRLARARDRLREDLGDMETPPLEALGSGLPSVHDVLYLLFNEGYLSAHSEHSIRRELCDEALRLACLLAEHAVGAKPDTFALVALMHLHAARLASRQDEARGLLLLEEQDRTLWDRERIRLGMEWLARAASGEVFSRYHAEAGIAAEHCLAASFAETRWQEVVDFYSMLERIAPSPLHTLSKAVAVAEWQGPAAGLSVLAGLVPPSWLAGSYLWDAVSSDLHRRAGNIEIAQQRRDRALGSAPTEAVRELLRRRLAGL